MLLAEEVGKDAGQAQLQASSLLWNRRDSPLKVIVRQFEGHSGVRDQQ